jgi:hypothetical protein
MELNYRVQQSSPEAPEFEIAVFEDSAKRLVAAEAREKTIRDRAI